MHDLGGSNRRPAEVEALEQDRGEDEDAKGADIGFWIAAGQGGDQQAAGKGAAEVAPEGDGAVDEGVGDIDQEEGQWGAEIGFGDGGEADEDNHEGVDRAGCAGGGGGGGHPEDRGGAAEAADEEEGGEEAVAVEALEFAADEHEQEEVDEKMADAEMQEDGAECTQRAEGVAGDGYTVEDGVLADAGVAQGVLEAAGFDGGGQPEEAGDGGEAEGGGGVVGPAAKPGGEGIHGD